VGGRILPGAGTAAKEGPGLSRFRVGQRACAPRPGRCRPRAPPPPAASPSRSPGDGRPARARPLSAAGPRLLVLERSGEPSLHPKRLRQHAVSAGFRVVVPIQPRMLAVVALAVYGQARADVVAAQTELAAVHVARPAAMMRLQQQPGIAARCRTLEQRQCARFGGRVEPPPAPVDGEVRGLFRQQVAEFVRLGIQVLRLGGVWPLEADERGAEQRRELQPQAHRLRRGREAFQRSEPATQHARGLGQRRSGKAAPGCLEPVRCRLRHQPAFREMQRQHLRVRGRQVRLQTLQGPRRWHAMRAGAPAPCSYTRRCSPNSGAGNEIATV